MEAIHAAFHRPGTDAYAFTNAVIWALIFTSLVLLGLEPLVGELPVWGDMLTLLDRSILAIFAIEIILRVGSYVPSELHVIDPGGFGRIRAHILGRFFYCFQPLNIVDILTVLAFVPALRGLRVVRLLRLLRAVRIFRYTNPFAGLFYAFERDRLLFTFAFSILGVEVLIGGVSIFLIEQAFSEEINTLGDGIWFALVTITTVGFGDIAPDTGLGRIVTSILMVGGMFTLALFAGIVGHTLLNTVLNIREENFRMSNYANHVVICGFDRGNRMLLDALRSEVDLEHTKVVIFSDRERPPDVAPEYIWVRGDPTKESELEKVRLTHAAAVIIVGERSVAPQNADATTILTTFTIRAHTSKHDEYAQRQHPLYIAAEILDSENVEHARTAGADEVIETHRLGFSLLAHAISQPGTADVLSRVVLTGDTNVYVSPVPRIVKLPMTFGQLRMRLKRKKGALVIGLRDVDNHVDRINPAEGILVGREDSVIYLAQSPVLDPDPVGEEDG